MSTPVLEKEQYSFPAFEPDRPGAQQRRSSEEDSTVHDDVSDEHINDNPLKLHTSYAQGQDHLEVPFQHSHMSPNEQREQSRRLDDDLELLRIEQVVSHAAKSEEGTLNRSRSVARSRSRTNEVITDDFDENTTPLHEKAKLYQPPANPATKFAKFFKGVHESIWLVRYFCYIAPVTILLLIPLLLGALVYKGESANVGGVELMWFSVWLEIVWLTLWAGRILAKCLPYPMGVVASIFTNNDKKWRDLGKALEIPATLFFWWLAVEVSFLPTMTNHHWDGNTDVRGWEATLNKIIVAVFVATVLNFVEKIIIQLIAISFHLRTYADRIDINKFQIGSLVKLYIYSKEKIALEDSAFEQPTGPSSGARTPMAYVNKAGKNARKVVNRVGDVAGKVAGDFTGKQVVQSTHPNQVVLQLLNTTSNSQVLARRLYRTFAQEGSETAFSDDLRPAFDNDEEANAAFTMFDRDMNGDISMDELEAVCVDVGRERKAIMASLKDLDSVVSKLDSILIFVVAIIVILVFISIISTSAQAAITSAGSAVLALSWLFSATAQEFLQSIIFVFVKHPFDVGDRVTIYGNTGSSMKGDDYFVKEISLLYTEFKKMEGHVVQAPNSYLNTLFILNQRRSGGLAEAVPVTVKFGTTIEQIESLRNKLLDFVGEEKREYQHNILTEIREVYEAYSVTLNVVFFYKSNWQNELLRLQRRNKFICALMVTMQDLGIEGPRQKLAGQSAEMPVYLQNAFPAAPQVAGQSSDIPPSGPGPRTGSLARDPSDASHPPPPLTHGSILRKRGESVSQMGKRVDFSLGMSSISSGADMGDVYDEEERKPRLPVFKKTSPSPGPRGRTSHDTEHSLARTTSRESGLERVTSGSSSNRTHRNRFFSSVRHRPRLGSADEGTNLDDLEAGTAGGGGGGGNIRFSLDEIHEEREPLARSRANTGEVAPPRIDPRTGIVSPQAVARDSALERGELPMAAGAGGGGRHGGGESRY